jgi:hypothetical protein
LNLDLHNLLLVPFNLDLDVGFGIEFGLEMDLDMDDVAGFVLRNFVLIKFILKKKTPNRPEFFFFFCPDHFQTVWAHKLSGKLWTVWTQTIH